MAETTCNKAHVISKPGSRFPFLNLDFGACDRIKVALEVRHP